jgi:uncharacterized membrane protein
MKIVWVACVLLIVLTIAVTSLTYAALPDPIPSHWNVEGQVDGYLPKFWGLAIIPFMMSGIAALFAVLPRIDPLRENYRKFQKYYEGFVLVLTLFLFLLQVQIILWGMGVRITPNQTFPILVGLMVTYIGFLTERLEQNWFVGIRTPWTLSSPVVWKKTHQRAGVLFKLAGLVSMAGALAGRYAFWFILVPILVSVVYLVIYSYVEYKKEQGTAETPG